MNQQWTDKHECFFQERLAILLDQTQANEEQAIKAARAMTIEFFSPRPERNVAPLVYDLGPLDGDDFGPLQPNTLSMPVERQRKVTRGAAMVFTNDEDFRLNKPAVPPQRPKPNAPRSAVIPGHKDQAPKRELAKPVSPPKRPTPTRPGQLPAQGFGVGVNNPPVRPTPTAMPKPAAPARPQRPAPLSPPSVKPTSNQVRSTPRLNPDSIEFRQFNEAGAIEIDDSPTP